MQSALCTLMRRCIDMSHNTPHSYHGQTYRAHMIRLLCSRKKALTKNKGKAPSTMQGITTLLKSLGEVPEPPPPQLHPGGSPARPVSSKGSDPERWGQPHRSFEEGIRRLRQTPVSGIRAGRLLKPGLGDPPYGRVGLRKFAPLDAQEVRASKQGLQRSVFRVPSGKKGPEAQPLGALRFPRAF